MGKTYRLLLFFICFYVDASSQILKGTVWDLKTNEPVINANVYLDKTAIGDVTDLNGYFEFSLKRPIYTRLIVSFVGYESVFINNPFQELPDTIYLKEKENLLDEVLVYGKLIFSREKMLNAFKNVFLGETQAGRTCKILNEDDIHLIYDLKTKTLSAYSDVPIEIENAFLKYHVHWSLADFRVEYRKSKSIQPAHIDTYVILGSSSFQDDAPNDQGIAKRRENVYRFSAKRFFCLLRDGNLEKSDFEVYERKENNYVRADSLFIVTAGTRDSMSKKVFINSILDKKYMKIRGINVYVKNTSIDKTEEYMMNRTAFRIARINEDALQYIASSEMKFYTDSFHVDAYGNTDLFVNLVLSGHMGKQRVGDMLPLDYVPSVPDPDKESGEVQDDYISFYKE